MQYDLPSHHAAQTVAQLARGLETPSQCLFCDWLFKLNWCFCNTALSEGSGWRIAETLRQREAHCGWSVPEVRWHCGHSMAGVKGHCGCCRATVQAQSCRVKSIRAGQRSLFCVCVLVLYYLFLCLCVSVCMYLYVCMFLCCVCLWKFSRHRPFPPLESAVCSLRRETDRQRGRGSCGRPHYASIVPMWWHQ